MTPLDQLKPSMRGTIQQLHVSKDLSRRMAGLGLRPGSTVEVIRIGPLNGPMQVRIGRTDLMLRRSEAAQISICLLV
ncbi:MAG: ferrous iron transport protein A [Hydrogenophilaceae bacterium]|nr:ferrous iron transport protein A [Hydrogenophilaceae bacterium]